MLLGLVSNCWRIQLAEGVPLQALIADADARGFRAVELRQGSLGEMETGDPPLPDPQQLTDLPTRFPSVRFNVAVNVPFCDASLTSADPVFNAGRWTAQAVAGESPPHLRLVDLTTTDVSPGNIDAVAGCVADLTRAMAEIDGVLSIENSRQPWNQIRGVFDAARQHLGSDADRLRLCFDPCNLLTPDDDVSIPATIAALDPGELSMVHLKQRRDGPIRPAVCDGDVDWQAALAALGEIGYSGPFLFEVDSHPRLWDFLAGSIEYLKRLGLPIEAGRTVGRISATN